MVMPSIVRVRPCRAALAKGVCASGGRMWINVDNQAELSTDRRDRIPVAANRRLV